MWTARRFLSVRRSRAFHVTQYEEARVKRQVQDAMQRVRQLLDSTRNPQHAGDVFHGYDDKFTLAQISTQTAIAAHLNAFGAAFDLKEASLASLSKWTQDKEVVTLRLSCTESCKF